MRTVIRFVRSRGAALLALAMMLIPDAAHADRRSHLFHLTGLQAYLGTRNASMLYQEATGGELDATLAEVSAAALVDAASKLSTWLDQLTALPASDAATIADEIVEMRVRVVSANKRAAVIHELLAGTGMREEAKSERAASAASTADFVLVPAATATEIAERSREIFFDFSIMQRQLKSAETKLGVLMPNDPPVPEGGPQPAK